MGIACSVPQFPLTVSIGNDNGLLFEFDESVVRISYGGAYPIIQKIGFPMLLPFIKTGVVLTTTPVDEEIGEQEQM